MHQELCAAWMVLHVKEDHGHDLTLQAVIRNDRVRNLEKFTRLRQCDTCVKQHCRPDYIEQHEIVCKLALETYKKLDAEEEEREEAAASSSAGATPDVMSDDSNVDISKMSITGARALYSEHNYESNPKMERFYYDQTLEFNERPFLVATYGDIVPFLRDIDAGRLRLYMEMEVPPGAYDARDDLGTVMFTFTVGLHFQDYRRLTLPPVNSARNPVGYAWHATMLSALSSPAVVTSIVYLMFPSTGIHDVTDRQTKKTFGRLEITDDCLFDDHVCAEYYTFECL